MADLSFGLAKLAVQGSIAVVKSAIEDEKRLRKSMQVDLVFISDELEMMHCFLNDNQDHVTDDVTKTYVSQVRNIALDVEDYIDSGVHLDNKSNWFRRMLPSWIPAARPATDLDAAAADMELLKARVEAMSQRSKRYKHIGGDSGSKAAEQIIVVKTTASNIFITDREATKKQTKPAELVKLIRNEDGVSQLRVVSVLGTRSDLGVVSIKKAYDDPEICSSFRCRAWVKTTMHPFNPYEFIRSLLAQFRRNHSPQQEVDALELTEVLLATNGLLLEEFEKQMSNHRYLVVLEDVSSMVDWEACRVYLPDKNNGSCIVVHTQVLGIASLCVGHPQRTSELEKFSADHSVYVFFKEDAAGEETVDKLAIASEWLGKHQLIGRGTDLAALFSLLRPGQVASVWGMSGVGKSFLVKHLYYKKQINNQNLDNKFGWVTVSRPFNIMDLSWNLLLDFNPGPLPHCMKLTIKDPIQQCREYLHQHKCLIVIDGLQSVIEWDLTKDALELGNSGLQHSVIIITSEESVANHCATNQGFVFNVRAIEPEHGIELFKTKVKRRAIVNMDDESRIPSIVAKCGGLPKVICAVADIDSARVVGREEKLWSVLEANAKIPTENLKDLFDWSASYLHSYLDNLKYLSVFPPHHLIRRRRLVRRFIAEGYAGEDMGSVEEKGEKLLSKLVNLSIIQVPETMKFNNKKRIPFCQLNGFFHEYGMSRLTEDDAFFTLEGCHSKRSFQGRHLVINYTWDRDISVYIESIDFARLRSLTVFGKWESFFISDKMRLLRVLDLEDSSGVYDDDVEWMLKLLPRLKFLSLRGCHQITCLPYSLGDSMKRLQTLDIRGTSVVRLPMSIIKLEKLQYIRAGTGIPRGLGDDGCHTHVARVKLPLGIGMRLAMRAACIPRGPGNGYHHSGVKLPLGIGRLANLHTLGAVDMTDVNELNKLTQVRKLGVCGINQNNWSMFFSAISDLAHLASLSLEVQLDEDACMELNIRPPRNLESLKLYGLLQKLPVWTKELLNLQKLSLHMTMLPQKGLDDLLFNLVSLSILRLSLSQFQNSELHFGTQAVSIHFGLLEVSCHSRIQATIKFSASFDLEVLRIFCWGQSSLLISGLQHLDQLKKVYVSKPCGDDHKQRFQSEVNNYPVSQGRSRPDLKFDEEENLFC